MLPSASPSSLPPGLDPWGDGSHGVMSGIDGVPGRRDALRRNVENERDLAAQPPQGGGDADFLLLRQGPDMDSRHLSAEPPRSGAPRELPWKARSRGRQHAKLYAPATPPSLIFGTRARQPARCPSWTSCSRIWMSFFLMTSAFALPIRIRIFCDAGSASRRASANL